MKKTLLTIAIATLLLASACTKPKNPTAKLENMDDTLSWILGMNIGESLENTAVFNLNEDLMMEAIHNTLQGKEQPIDDTIYDGGMQYIMMMSYQKQQKEIGKQRREADSIQNAFFSKLVAENKNVKRHKAGFYYEVMR